MPAAGFARVTLSVAVPPADWALRTHVPVVQLKRERSRSVPAADGLPMAAEIDVAPAGTMTWNCCCARLAIVGRSCRVAPRSDPRSRPTNGSPVLRTV
jgi:hypothetical protein